MKKQLFTLKKLATVCSLACLMVLAFCQSAWAQTTLTYGDVVVTGWNNNLHSGNRQIQFLLLKAISSGTVIKFTNSGFNSTSTANTSGNTRTQGGTTTWTAGTSYPAGTLINYSQVSTTSASVDIGTIGFITTGCGCGGNNQYMIQGTPGGKIFIYQGGTGESTSTDYSSSSGTSNTLMGQPIYLMEFQGQQTNTTWISSGTIGNYTTYLPSDLNSYSIFLASNAIGGYYNGSRSGTISALRTAILNPANWTTTSGTGTVTIPTGAFTITSPPSATTNSATSITGTGAVVNGTINDNGATTSITFVYGLSATLASGNTTVSATPSSIASGTGSTAVSKTISGLTGGNTYYFRVSGNNSQGTTNGSILNFTTTASSPSVTVTSQTNVACNGASTGALGVTATGGTPSYSYSWSPGGFTTASISGRPAGTYTCTVTDAASGTATVTATITQPSSIVGSISSITNVACNGGSTGAIDLTVSGGTPGYTYSWNPGGATTQDRSGIAAGSYTCTITDANSCIRTVTATVTQPTAVGGSTIVTNVSCGGGTTGSIDLTPSGGTPGYTYNWGGGVTTQDRTGLAAGSYTCVVTDANSCTGTVTATVTQPTSVNGSKIITNVACSGGTTGSIDLTPTGGTPGYTYNWGGGVTTQDRTGLAAGSYTCVVTDANSCTGTVTATVTQPTSVGGSTTVTNVACRFASTGSIDLTPTGGTPGYTYNWGGGVTTQDRTGLAAGSYTCVVTDANSCTGTVTATVTQPAASVGGSTSVTNVTCGGGTTGSIDLTPSGGTPGYTYNWGGGVTTQDRTGLAAGSYTCVVTDANSCTGTVTATVTQPTAVGGSFITFNPGCFGASSGAIDLTPSGGTPGYTYNWGGGVTTQDRTGLAAGSYTCVVTDANSCTGTVTATVTQPAAVGGSTIVTNVACNGGTNGSIDLTPTGGTPGYTYNWGGGVTTQDRTGLAAGSYTCVVTDANSCTGTVTATVTQPTPVGGSTIVTNVACRFGTNGSIDLTPSGGTPGYTYNWGGGVTTQDRTGLAAGSYTCVVTDANSCTGTVTATVTQPASSVGGSTVVTNVACNGSTTGSIDLTPSGGTPGYTYNWGGGVTTQDRTGIAAGSYTCVVTDANSCTGTVTATVTQPTAVGGSTTVTNVSCNGGTTGSIDLTPSGGTPGYTYNWGGGVTTQDRTGLAAGSYTCVVTDANSCTGTVTATVTQPAAVGGSTTITNVSCNGFTNGSIDLTPSGGTPGYTYNWGGGVTTQDRTGLAAGAYTCVVTDANSCTGTVIATVTQPATLTATVTAIVNVTCFGGSNGSTTVTPGGGTPAYSYAWAPSGGTAATASGLATGTYTCTVTDANGCSLTRAVFIAEPASSVSTSISSQTNVDCRGNSTGAATISPSGGTPGYTYTWSPSGGTGATATGLPQGSYTCTVTDANSCTAAQIVSITQPAAALTATVTAIVNVTCFGGSNGSTTVTPGGGTPGYSYSWAPSGGSAATASSLAIGVYTCTITDANGCTYTRAVSIAQPPAITSTVTAVTNVTCAGGSNGSATVSAGGGVGGFTYSWSPVGGSAATGTGFTAGSYTCTITDANSCSHTQIATITEPTGITGSISGTNVTCNGFANGTASVSASGGTGTLTYSWAPSGGTASSATGLAPGSYTCTVSDASSCTLLKTITITQPGSLVISSIGNNGPVCVNDALNLSSALSGGNTPYAYSWSGPNGFSSTQQNPTISGVTTAAAGSYTMVPTDANSCPFTGTNTTSVTVNTLPVPSFTALPNPTLVGLPVAFSSSTPLITLYSWNFGDATGTTGASVSHAYGSGGAFTPTLTVTDVNGCQASVTTTVTVNTTVTPIVGTPLFCIGDAPDTLSHEITGGTWTSSNPSGASVGLTTGIVTGIAPGYCVITYHIGAGYTQTVAAIVAPLPPAITGPATTCFGSTSGLIGAPGTSSTWSSSNTAVATVGTGSGVVSGIAVGTATMTYTNSYGCYVTREHTVNTAPAAISGYTTLCAGSTTTLTCTPSGGSWTSSNAGVVSIDNTTGVATGVATGTTIISYILTTGCSSSILITPLAQPGAVTGMLTLCPGGTTTLSSTTSGGTWSSSDGSVATIHTTSGLVTAIGAGTATITYTAASGCTRMAVVTVNTPPAASTGNVAICVGGTLTLANATSGGTWSSSSTGIATVNIYTGLVTGIGVGNANITYAVSGAGCYNVTQVTVNAIPADITGTSVICIGDTVVLSHPTSGGTWVCGNTAIATVGSATGEVIGLTAGVAPITYYTSATCFKTIGVTVRPLPAPISGATQICEGTTTTLTSSTSYGTWSSSNTAVAYIHTLSGIATGVTTGTTTITYTSGSGCTTTSTISVNPAPAAITGTTSTCVGTSTTLSCATSSGSWSSSNTAIATVGSSTGVVTGAATGTARISYILPTGCYATIIVTVSNLPAAITGSLTLCDGGNVTILSSTTTGGTWSSSNTGVATTGTAMYNSTTVTGVATGTADISYTVGGCARTATVSVNAGPGAISGNTSLCIGSTSALTVGGSGGTWSSSSTAYASVGSTSGIVTAAAAGVATISYKMSATCYTTTAVTVITSPASITGSTMVCVGLTTTLSHTTSGGTWASSATSTATVDGSTGVVTGVATGTTTISYTLSPGCFKTTTITVYGPPSAIGGTGVTCVGSATTLTNTTSGGTWASGNTGVATVGVTTGLVAGISGGNATITYQLSSTGCYITKDVTINALPAAISGSSTVCAGGTTTLTCTTTGGTWSSSSSTIAPIGSSTGIVTGGTGGGATINYTLPTGCQATFYITVVNPPAAISGILTMCTGNTTTLSCSTAGQTWSSSNTSVATVGSATSTTGLVTGTGAGTATISYTNATGCSRTTVVTVDAPLSANTGDNVVCIGQTVTLSNAVSGGTWASSTTAKATVGYYTGVVTGVATGTSNITYKVPSGCLSITQVTVNAAPAAITGPTSVCTGLTITLSHTTSGGSWSCSSATATIDAGTGVVTGVSPGYAYITYTLTSGCYKTTVVLVKAGPHAISGPTSVAIGSYIALTSATGGGAWSSGTPAIASMPYSTLGYVLGVSTGSATITYAIASTGCYTTYTVSVYSTSGRPGITNDDIQPSAFSVFPNPTSGSLNVNAEVDGEFTLYTLDGKMVQQYQIATGTTSISLPNELAQGIYMGRFNGIDGSSKMVRLVVAK